MAKSLIILFVVYYAAINLTLFAMMGIDKAKAKRGLWRIPEPTLLTISVMGGALGGILGMYVFNHKKRKRTFRKVFFLSMIFHVFLMIMFYKAVAQGAAPSAVNDFLFTVIE